MTLWDTFTGRKPASSSTTSASPSEPTTTFDSTPTTYTFAQPTAQSATDLLNSVSIPDPSALHPLAGLNAETLDYLTLEDSPLAPAAHAALPSRGWSDDLCYGTGITYISALSVGGVWGLIEGLNRTPASAPPKLRLNSVLNSVTRRGPFVGNSAGVIALVYSLVNSGVGSVRGKSDAVNSVVAGAVSGMLFKSTRGLRPMMISGGLVAGAAGAWAVTRKALF